MPRPLTLVVCGAPLAARAAEAHELLTSRGWAVTVVRTLAAAQWYPVTHEVTARTRPERVVALPLSFNTANKVAAGIMDSPVCGVLCDALGARVPVTAVAMVNDRLWTHPVWPATLETLVDAGVTFVDAASGRLGAPSAVRSGSGPDVVAAFDIDWIVSALSS